MFHFLPAWLLSVSLVPVREQNKKKRKKKERKKDRARHKKENVCALLWMAR